MALNSGEMNDNKAKPLSTGAPVFQQMQLSKNFGQTLHDQIKTATEKLSHKICLSGYGLATAKSFPLKFSNALTFNNYKNTAAMRFHGYV